MVQVFLSLRFDEAMKQGQMMKEALEKRGVTVFLCSVHSGDSILKAVAKNLFEAELVVILGTKTYGKETESSYSTCKELQYTMEKKKPFFLVKMCDCYEEYLADFYFDSTVAYHFWPVKDHGKLPMDLTGAILAKLNNSKKAAIPITAATKTTEEILEEILEELQVATDRKTADDHRKVIEILQTYGTVDKEVAYSGCVAVYMLACFGNNKELGRLGACKAVVDALKAFGAVDEAVAHQGCAAVQYLASDDDNKSELLALGVVEALKKSLDIGSLSVVVLDMLVRM
jgi:hypothetical protein